MSLLNLFNNKIPASSNVEQDSLREVNERLYKQNLELAVKNKTLSLLRQLYQTSISTHEILPLAEKITETIQTTLNGELCILYTYNQTADTLTPLACSSSSRFDDARLDINTPIETENIYNAFSKPFLKSGMKGKTIINTEDFGLLWENIFEKKLLEDLQKNAHIKATLILPLIIENKPIGVFLLSQNRPYADLSEYEKEAIKSIIDVVSVALDKAKLYNALTEANSHLVDANSRLKELDQQKSEFISLASHQLRGPLTAIKGYASLILEGDYGDVSSEVKEAVEVINKSTQALVVIVGDYLDVSRIEQGRMKYDFTTFDLKDLTESVVEELTPTVESAGLSISLKVEEGSDNMINADQGKIKQVISNLIDNSIKYTKEGSIEIDLKRKGDKFLTTVKDSGVGIDPDVMPKLFDKFTRAPDASKTNTLGTGLGLYVASKFVEAHKGKIWAESKGKNKGSIFFVELEAHHKNKLEPRAYIPEFDK